MSRGPGRIERAIRQLFDAYPDAVFTTEELAEHCYPDVPRFEFSLRLPRKHRVAVLRAANHVLASHPDWRSRRTWRGANAVVFYNAASLRSTIGSRGDNVSLVIKAPDGSWQAEQRDRARQAVAEHVEVREADPADRPRIEARQKAEHDAWFERHMMLVLPPKALSLRAGASTATHKALAAKARALMTQNDPDAIRAGLAEIADALDQLGGREAPILDEAAD